MVYMSGSQPKRTRAQKFFRFLAGVAVTGLVVWLLYLIPYDILREERARLFGEEVTSGEVLSVESDESPEFPGAKLIVEYRYVDPDGFARRAKARIPDNLWQRYRKGAVIKVIYGRTQPGLVRVPDEIEPAFQTWLRNVLH